MSSPASYVKEAPKQDYELAKKLLVDAGHKDGLKFDLYTAEGVPGMVRMAQVYAEMAKPAGIDINVIVTPAESFWDDVWLKQPAVTSAWSMRPPGEGLAVAYTQSAKWKETLDGWITRNAPPNAGSWQMYIYFYWRWTTTEGMSLEEAWERSKVCRGYWASASRLPTSICSSAPPPCRPT